MVCACLPLPRERGPRIAPRKAVVWLLAISVLAMVPACAPKAPPVTPGAPKYPDFVFPAVPADLTKVAASRAHEAAWRQLQAGDTRGSLRAFEQILKQNPSFYPADAGAGWAALAARDAKPAAAAFERVLGRTPKYVSALVGRGEALLALKDEDGALASFEAALAVDPELLEVHRRVEVLRFRGLEGQLTSARTARDTGRLDEARRAYLHALELSPDSALVYRELAEVERKASDLAAALEHARAAARIDPSDPAAFVLVGEICETRGETDAAIEAYNQALAIDGPADLSQRIERLRRAAAFAQLPQQYRDLGSAARITRGDLAALLGIRLESVVKGARKREGVLLTDVRGHWAATWISTVTQAGILQPYANHTFQPRNVVRRSDLAEAVSRVLSVIGARDNQLAEAWSGKRLAFSDLGGGHAMYPAASVAVASGVMLRLDKDAFGPSTVVSGAEAISTLERLEALAMRAGFAKSGSGGR